MSLSRSMVGMQCADARRKRNRRTAGVAALTPSDPGSSDQNRVARPPRGAIRIGQAGSVEF
jgi:hypothetical protein